MGAPGPVRSACFALHTGGVPVELADRSVPDRGAAPRGYFWLVVMLTPTALLMLSVAAFEGFEVGVQRTLNSALGIALGLVIGEIAWRIGRRPASVESIRR